MKLSLDSCMMWLASSLLLLLLVTLSVAVKMRVGNEEKFSLAL